MKTSEVKSLANQLRRLRWRSMPAEVLKSSLDAALAERRKRDNAPASFQGHVDRVWHVFWRCKWAIALLVIGSAFAVGVRHHNRVASSRVDAVRREIIKRAGSNTLLDLAPPTVPPEDNFWAIPAMQSCRLEPKTDDSAKYAMADLRWHDPGLCLPEFPDDGSDPDLDSWLKAAISAGNQPDVDATVVEALRDHVVRHSSRLDALIAGLERPKAQAIPDFRTRLAAVGGDMSRLSILMASNVNSTSRNLMSYARTAALCGDPAHAAGAVGVILRIGEGVRDGGNGLVGALVVIGVDGIVLEALPQCLSSAGWTEPSLAQLQRELSRADALMAAQRWMLWEALSGVDTILKSREYWERSSINVTPFDANWWVGAVVTMAPRSIIEDNAALFGELMLGCIGPDESGGWIEAEAGWQQIHKAFAEDPDDEIFESYWKRYSPTRIIANFRTPMVASLVPNAARASFKRRAAALTCALMRHRLAHGADPATLDSLVPEYVQAKIEDPAKPGEWLKFRREADGSLLIWSIGPDRRDDSGAEEVNGGDWRWAIPHPAGQQ